MLEVVGESTPHIAHGKRDAFLHQVAGGERLQGALPIIRREIVQLVGHDFIHAHHLGIEQTTDAVVIGVGIMARCSVEEIVASLGRDNIKKVYRSMTVDDMPLGAVAIDGRLRNSEHRTHISLPLAREGTREACKHQCQCT